jgi:hypothetical protein
MRSGFVSAKLGPGGLDPIALHVISGRFANR